MTNASREVAVIATQFAQTDRRALSQAWYSALHLARESAPAPLVVRPRAPATPAARSGAPAAAHDHAASAAHGTQPVRRISRAHVQLREASAERRRPADAGARRIERTLSALAARRPVPAAQSVALAGGRVRLLVHGDGRTLRIVALCSDGLREPVERALAHARFALAGRGVAVRA